MFHVVLHDAFTFCKKVLHSIFFYLQTLSIQMLEDSLPLTLQGNTDHGPPILTMLGKTWSGFFFGEGRYPNQVTLTVLLPGPDLAGEGVGWSGQGTLPSPPRQGLHRMYPSPSSQKQVRTHHSHPAAWTDGCVWSNLLYIIPLNTWERKKIVWKKQEHWIHNLLAIGRGDKLSKPPKLFFQIHNCLGYSVVDW